MALLLGGAVATDAAGARGKAHVKVQYHQELGAQPGTASKIDVLAGDTATVDGVLKLCQCEDASISSNGGLNCVKDGWFISTFEATGHWVRCSTPTSVVFTIRT